jgi:DNA segregation ATPase FtsK/SpoIIIE-like protein
MPSRRESMLLSREEREILYQLLSWAIADGDTLEQGYVFDRGDGREGPESQAARDIAGNIMQRLFSVSVWDEGDASPVTPAPSGDPMFEAAARLVIASCVGTTSLLQRRLTVGYGRAARLIDELCAAGILGPADGSHARRVLVTEAQLVELLRRPS